MTGKVINLRQARKAKARDEKRATAETNAAQHGQTKAERTAIQNEKSRARHLLDGHEMTDGGDDIE